MTLLRTKYKANLFFFDYTDIIVKMLLFLTHEKISTIEKTLVLNVYIINLM